MSGAATATITMAVTGLGDSVTKTNTKIMTVPTKMYTGYTVLTAATTTGLNLFEQIDPEMILLAKIYGVYLKAESGTILITIDTASNATLTASTADLVLNEGEACYLPINPAGNLGLVLDGLAVTDAVSWLILAKA